MHQLTKAKTLISSPSSIPCADKHPGHVATDDVRGYFQRLKHKLGPVLGKGLGVHVSTSQVSSELDLNKARGHRISLAEFFFELASLKVVRSNDLRKGYP